MGRNPDWDAIMCLAITNCKNPGPINKTGLSSTTGASGLSSTEDDDAHNADEGGP